MSLKDNVHNFGQPEQSTVTTFASGGSSRETRSSKASLVKLDTNSHAQLRDVPHNGARFTPNFPLFLVDDQGILFDVVKLTLGGVGLPDQQQMLQWIMVALLKDIIISMQDLVAADPCPDDIYFRSKQRIVLFYRESEDGRLRKLLKGEI